MSETIQGLIESWDGIGVVTRFHPASGSWIFIALHSDRLGAPCGGTRLKPYERPADGLRDALRLAAGMTHKWAALQFDSGGGKAVLAVPPDLDVTARRALLTDYAHLLEKLGGFFSTGRDLGTTDDDMRTLAAVTEHVHGVDRTTMEARDPGPYTARGVAAAIRATLQARFGSPELDGRRILIQGLGGVGRPLAERLAEGGARLLLCDVDSSRAEELSRELGASTVPVESAHRAECDLYAPCALGATLSRRTIPELRCGAVAGSANNQLAEDDDALRLHERGILYAPDFISNGGGALGFGLIHRGETDERAIGERLDGIEANLVELFAAAQRAGESPRDTAMRRIRKILG